ncbi:DUF4265 domain-containing protein [Streptomyces roseicoloratus]|uniref:DUF4265 domain-containing protein n=1 Tax=Streptomyces roseicoloratus TaxID=2508722 RepID=A0ABY9S3U7_9ACTN|nr:DUF4265 domain-containing protein [Streptomyces roseicoloratus]WMX48932.1 DUF4265 domain-containing protein [Streptomyces roseicoloratus]
MKIWFRSVPHMGRLSQDTEGLWAVPVGADTARVVNVPFLQDGVAEGDLVRYTTDAEGTHWATGRAEASGNVTIRVLPVRHGPLGPDARAVHEWFARFGPGGESFGATLPLVALTVPADAPMAEIKALLVRGVEDGWWHWETGCATDTWNAA